MYGYMHPAYRIRVFNPIIDTLSVFDTVILAHAVRTMTYRHEDENASVILFVKVISEPFTLATVSTNASEGVDAPTVPEYLMSNTLSPA